ncbi:hypothetical protein [Pseudomonas sp. NW5]|uniref:hypothetical protein n=1 Tax=Pseudomonas sp. NW5 TaxID=2934934 RepID=UPI0020211F93|nr:hypothetical protein [Pseudomonas sp. NW5]MCL7462912.1 hypothetical protein [Pseudomonas sp. NW5]
MTHKTLDDLAATSSHFAVALEYLRGQREPDYDALEIPQPERPALLTQQRDWAANRLVAWVDALESVGHLETDNADDLQHEIVTLWEAR